MYTPCFPVPQLMAEECLSVLPEKGQSAPPLQGQQEVQEQKCGLCSPIVLQKPLGCPSCMGFWEMQVLAFLSLLCCRGPDGKKLKKASRQQLRRNQCHQHTRVNSGCPQTPNDYAISDIFILSVETEMEPGKLSQSPELCKALGISDTLQ